MNIIEAFLKNNNQCIILISSFPDCVPPNIIENLAKALKFHFVSTNSFLESVDKKYSNNSYNWDKLNEVINKNKANGVIISGIILPVENTTFKIDYHVHLALNKQNIMTRLQKNKIISKEVSEKDKTLVNKIIYPYYLESIKKTTINTFVNAYTNEKLLDDNIVEDNIWDNIMTFIKKSIISS